MIKSFELNKFLQFYIYQKRWHVDKSFDLNQSFALLPNFILFKRATHSHNPIASLSQSVITYCYQKNPLRVRTKPNIQFCYAWSSQRFKSLPSILCEIVVVQSRLPDKSRSFSQNNVSTGDLNRGRRVKPRLLFGSFCRSKKNKLVPFRELPDKQEVCPCRGRHASRAIAPFLLETWSPCSHPFAILPVSAVSDAQKLATGNFLHVRAGSFEVLQTSNQRT